MKYKEGIWSRAFDIFNYVFLILLMIITIYPLFNVFALSVSESKYIIRGVVTWFPKGFTLSGYDVIFKSPKMFDGYKWTILYAIGSVAFTLVLTSMLAYALAVKEFIYRKFLMIFLAITMFFGGGLIPSYINIKNLGLIDTYWVMVIPGCVSAFNVIMFRTFFDNIVKDLREAAVMDGANDIIILFKIILPLSKSLLATFTLFTVVGVWNSWFNAMLYISDEARYPLQMVLRGILSQNPSDQLSGASGQIIAGMTVNPKNIQMAAVFFAMAPILLMYPFLQKHFVKGVMIGSIKG